MEIIVDGMLKELRAVDSNGVEWTRDLLGGYDALEYDSVHDCYVMDADTYLYWDGAVELYNEVLMLEPDILDECRDEYLSECWPDGLKEELEARIDWMKQSGRLSVEL